MADLSKYVTYACGFVNFDQKTIDDKADLLMKFDSFCKSYKQITDYYFICHTETNIIHIHFAFYFSSHVQLMTLFNKMRSWFVEQYHLTRNAEGITLSPCISLNAYIRYMVHQDKESIKEGKQPYDLDDIVSNLDLDSLQVMFNSQKGEIDAYYLRDCVLDCNNEFELMNKLGLKIYHKYRYEIQILQDSRVYLTALREKEKQDHIDERLPF